MNISPRSYCAVLLILIFGWIALGNSAYAQDTSPDPEAPPQTSNMRVDIIPQNTFQITPTVPITQQTDETERDGPPGQIVDVPHVYPNEIAMPVPIWQPSARSADSPTMLVSYSLETGEEEFIPLSAVPVVGSDFMHGSDVKAAPQSDSIPSLPTSPDDISGFSGWGPVSNVQSMPWQTVVKLYISHDELTDSVYVCSGTLIDPVHVLTAGNCVYNRSRGYGWATSIRAVPAFHNGTKPFGEAISFGNAYSFRSWIEDGNFGANLGLIKFNRPIGSLANWLGYGFNESDTYFSTNTFTNPGYPASGSHNGQVMYSWSGTFDVIEPTTLTLNNQLDDGGFTGSGAFINGNSRVIRSVYSFIDGGKAGYTRLVSSTFNFIKQTIADNTPSQPDLIALDVNLGTDSIIAGDNLLGLEFTVHNYSSATWDGIATIEFRLSDNDTISVQSDTLIGSYIYDGTINAKASKILVANPAPDIDIDTPSGIYWIGAIIKYSDYNTGNNITQGWDAEAITVEAPPPEMVVSPQPLDFEATFGGSSPAAKTILVDDSGYGSFTWNASADKPWIKLQPTGGSNGQLLSVTVDPALASTSDSGTITITGDGNVEQSTRVQTVQVNLDIKEATLQFDPPTLDDFVFTLTGAQQDSRTVDVIVNGSGTYNWTATPSSELFTVDPPSGTNNGTVTVSVDASTLDVGTYAGDEYHIGFELRDGSGVVRDEADLFVTIEVLPGDPTLMVSPTALAFRAVAGGVNPGSQTLVIDSGIDYPFGWRATSDASWLPVNEVFGTTPGIHHVSPDITGLAPGDYSTQIVINGATEAIRRAGAAPPPVEVTLHIESPESASPILQVAPPNLSYEAVVGSGNPPPLSFIVDNIGNGTLQWNATTNADWLSLGPSAGSGAAEITAQVDIAGLSAGTHVAEIAVTGGDNATQIVTVLLTLREPPTMAIDGVRLMFTGLANEEAPADRSFRVRNAGDGTFSWTAVESIPWLELMTTSGEAPASVNVSAKIDGLDVGIYEGDITISSDTALNSPQQIEAKLNLRQGPVLNSYPQSVAFDAISGEPGPQPVPLEIINVSRGTLNWTVDSDAAWLSVAQSSGSVNDFERASIDMAVNPGALEPRDEPYLGQLTVRSSNAEGSPQTVNVAMTVFSKARYCRIPDGGSDWILNTSHVKLKFEEVINTGTSDGGCDLSGKLVGRLPQNAQITADIAGHVDADNNFIPTSSSALILEVASLKLQLAESFSISDEFGIRAEGGTWTLPTELGGSQSNFNGTIQIGPKGLTIAGQQSFDFPDVDWGTLTLQNLKGKVRFSTDGAYVLTLTGDMRIRVSGSGDVVANGLSMEIDKKGVRSGKIGYFEVPNFAGLTLKVHKATIESGKLRAQETELAIPDAWGGAEVALYGLEIYNDGSVSISGGRFRLPEIDAGGDSFKLASLEGELKKVGSGYEIRARGKFGANGLSDVGDCAIWVDVTIYTDATGASVLDIDSDGDHNSALASQAAPVQTVADPNTGESIDSFSLRRLTIGVRCTPGIAIGTTGFFLTGVEGTIELKSSIEQVRVKVWIESGTKVGNVAAVSAVPTITLRPDPFKISFEAPVSVLSVKAQDSKVEIESRRFHSEMTYNYIVIHAGLSVDAGLDNSRKFYFVGSGWADVKIEKGKVVHECARICDPTGLFGGKCYEECLYIPSSTINIARADARVDLKGISGKINVLGHNARFYFDFSSGGFSTSRSLVTHKVTSADLIAARPQWEATQRGEVTAAGLHQTLQLQGNGLDQNSMVTIEMPVVPAATKVSASDVISSYTSTLRSDVVFGLTQPVSATLSLSLIDPSGVEITPLNLPENIQYESSKDGELKQVYYSIAQAEPGVWKTNLRGATDATPFYLAKADNTPAPELNNLSLTETDAPHQASLRWSMLSGEPGVQVNVYATTESITQSVTYTDAFGVPVTGITDRFVGTPVGENLPTPGNGTLQQQLLDLSELPSGVYSFWIEAIGPQGGDVRCYLRQNTPGCTVPEGEEADGETGAEAGPVIKIRIDHSNDFPTAWAPTIDTTVDIKRGEMMVEWDMMSNPDVDFYTLRVRGTMPLSSTQEVVREFRVEQSTGVGVGYTYVDGIEPGQTYHLSVGAHDRENERVVWSPEQPLTTALPDFIITTAATNLQVATDGLPLNVPIDVELSSDIPYAIDFALDYTRLADGIYAEFSQQVVAANVSSANFVARITVSEALMPGHYVVPIMARSGQVEHQLNLDVEVIAAAGGPVNPDGNPVFLPIVVR